MREKIHITGDCLEGVGIPNGGIAVVDRDVKPNVFDVVWCDVALGGISGCLKQIIKTGDRPIVQTVYKDHDRDFAFCSPEIFGVVLKVMDYDRNVVWERPEPVEYAPVKYGRWEHIRMLTTGDGRVKVGDCSSCKSTEKVRNYCPNCGAKMDLKETQRAVEE